MMTPLEHTDLWIVQSNEKGDHGGDRCRAWRNHPDPTAMSR